MKDNELRPDRNLEKELEKKGDYGRHRAVKAIQEKSGVMNFIRNKRNKKQSALEDVLSQMK